MVSVVAKNEYNKLNSFTEQKLNFLRLISSNEWKQRDNRNKLQDSSQIPDEQVRKLVTNPPEISWDSWCSQKQIDSFQCTINLVTNFLAQMFENGLEYQTLNSYSSAILYTPQQWRSNSDRKTPISYNSHERNFKFTPFNTYI